MKKIILVLLSALGLSAFAGPGFYQALYSGSSATTGYPFTDGVVVGEMGLAKTGNSYTVGESTYTMANNTTAAYSAYWMMTAGVKYSFVKNFDDWGYVYITSPSGVGTEVLKDGSCSGVVYKTYTPTETGFHTIDVRVGQGSGGIGPTTAPFNSTLSGMIWSDDASITGWNSAQANLYHCFANEDPAHPVFLTSKTDATVDLAYASETKTATISVTVKALLGETAGLKLVTKNPDKTVVTNVLQSAAAVSATPYEHSVTVADGMTEFVVLVDSGDDGIYECTVPGVYAGAVTIAAGENGDVNFARPGTFVISRGNTEADTAYPLIVNYGVTGGTATVGDDYVAPSGTVTIPAGESTAMVSIAPVYNKEATDAVTLTLGLTNGNYAIGTASAAEITFAKGNGYWTYDTTAKTITDGTWTFNVTVSGSMLKIASLNGSATGLTSLNFVKPVLDDNETVWPIQTIENNLLKNMCPTLTTLILPETLTYIGGSSFYGCPLEGDFVIGYGNAGSLNIDSYAFYGHKFVHIDLGPRVTRFGWYVFQSPNNNTLLDARLPDTLKTFESGPFSGCNALTNITPCLPKGITGVSHTMLSGLTGLRGTIEFCCGDVAYDMKENFANGTAIDAVIFGEKFTGIFKNWDQFSNTRNLRNIYFRGDNLPDFQGVRAFGNRARYSILIHVPESSETWKAVLADTQQVTPWAVVPAETKAKFREYFPTERAPKGLVCANWSTVGKTEYNDTLVDSWITDDSVDGSISIAGDPANAGTPSLGYGTHKYSELTAPISCTLDEYVPCGSVLYRTTGYTANYLDENGDVASTVTGSGTSFALNDLSSSVSLIWHFEPVGYRAEITMAEAEGRSVTEMSTPTLHGYYQAGDQMSYQVSGEGFVRWYGAVTGDDVTSRTITVTAGPGVVLMPYFTSVWTELEDGRLLSNGYWTFVITKSGSDITLVSAYPTACTLLDLSTGVEGGGRIVKIADSTCKNMTTLERLVLPDTLTHVYANAFLGCTSLRQVEPLLPDSVVEVQGNAFNGCPLEGHFRAGYGEGGNITLGGYSFSGHQLSSVDIGPRMTFISWYAFQSNKNKTLTDVRLPDYVQFDAGPFLGCVALTNMTPCLPSMRSTCHTMMAGLTGLTGTLEISCTQDFSIPSNFGKDSGFSAIVFGEKFTGVFPQWDSFSGMINLRDVYLSNDNLLDFKDLRSFAGRTRYRLVVHVPMLEKSPNWAAVVADPEQVTPWSQVPAEAKAKFYEYFPGRPHPKGLIVGAWSSTGKTSENDTLINSWITWPQNSALHIIVR